VTLLFGIAVMALVKNRLPNIKAKCTKSKGMFGFDQSRYIGTLSLIIMGLEG
jgi:hypothetical protein